jgi:hypothetical protein
MRRQLQRQQQQLLQAPLLQQLLQAPLLQQLLQQALALALALAAA